MVVYVAKPTGNVDLVTGGEDHMDELGLGKADSISSFGLPSSNTKHKLETWDAS
jgi:hypothetical protein